MEGSPTQTDGNNGGQEGGKRPITNRNQQALSAPPQVQGPHVSDKTQFRSQGLEPAGARSGLVGFDLCLVACPLPDCPCWFWFVFGRLPPS